MHSALNYRQSRRSACDRCRGFKLRCERDQVHGRSCERCLKAQVLCTTNIGHPAPNSLSSKGGTSPLKKDCDGLWFSKDRHAMSVLHRTSDSKVRKSVLPSETSRRLGNQPLSRWNDPNTLPFLSSEFFTSFDDDPFVQVPSHPNPFSFEPWEDHYGGCFPGPYDMPSVNNTLLGASYHIGGEQSFPGPLMVDPPSNTLDEPVMNVLPSGQSDHLHFSKLDCSSTGNENWLSRDQFKDRPNSDKSRPVIAPCVDQPSPSTSGLQKSLLRLNLDLIDDLELLEASSAAFGSTFLLGEDINSAIKNLDIPISRMLSHAEQFLGLLQSETAVLEKETNPYSIRSISNGSSLYEDSKQFSARMIENTEDGPISTSSLDSGYLTITSSPSDMTKSPATITCDISTSLSMLAAYCHLIRVYRAVFSQLYQLFLIVPPFDTAELVLLPSLQFGRFDVDGDLPVQIRALVEVASSMLVGIERHLGVCSGSAMETMGDSSLVPYILENSPLASLRDHITTHEQMSWGVSLKETMKCLKQLLNDQIGP